MMIMHGPPSRTYEEPDMPRPRSTAYQEVPEPFAETLLRLLDEESPLLNSALAYARDLNWSPESLGRILGASKGSIGKRVERSALDPASTVAVKALLEVSGMLRDLKVLNTAEMIEAWAAGRNPKGRIPAAFRQIEDLLAEEGVPTEARRVLAKARRILRHANNYRQVNMAEIKALNIPEPVNVRVTLTGNRITDAEIEELRGMFAVAKTVTGALPPGHEKRKISERFAKRLADLTAADNPNRVTDYYLASVLNTSHRAIASRLERHGHRPPLKSVRKRPGALYQNKRIGGSTPGTRAAGQRRSQEHAARKAAEQNK